MGSMSARTAFPFFLLWTAALPAYAGGACDGVPVATYARVSFVPHLVSWAAEGARSVVAADIDGDGDADLASASVTDGKVAWYENLDGAGGFGVQQVIGLVFESREVFAADLDGDDDLDILSAAWGSVGWYENLDDRGTFGPRRIIDPIHAAWDAVHASDLDGDGDFDVLAGSVGSDLEFLSWYENVSGDGTFVLVQDLHQFTGYPNVSAADMDGDGERDVLAATATGFYWFENGGEGSFVQRSFSSAAFRDHFAADVDGDHDMDVLAARTSQVVWFENLQNSGDFGAPQNVTNAIAESISVSAADLDGDGAIDVLSASTGDDKIAWYRNLDGAGTFGEPQVISLLADGPRSLTVADLDLDGDLDVAAAAEMRKSILVFENRGDDCAP